MRRRLPTLFALLLFGGSAGCMKAASGSYKTEAPYPEEVEMAQDGAYYDDEMGAGYGGISESEVMADAPAPDYDFGSRREMKKAAKSKDVAAGPIASPTPQAEPPPEAEPAIGEPDPQPDDHGRQIIYTANMQIGVYNVKEAMNVAESLPERMGGWVHARSEGYITMKIPAAKLRPAMAELSKLGNVLSRELQAQDVTAEFTDLETRIRVLRETQTQLLELLKKSKTVEEALNVRRALDETTMQLEMALGRMRQLQSQISFSTLTVTLTEQGPYTGTPSSNDPFPWVDSLGVEATEWR